MQRVELTSCFVDGGWICVDVRAISQPYFPRV
jgi:hypothetical protein